MVSTSLVQATNVQVYIENLVHNSALSWNATLSICLNSRHPHNNNKKSPKWPVLIYNYQLRETFCFVILKCLQRKCFCSFNGGIKSSPPNPMDWGIYMVINRSLMMVVGCTHWVVQRYFGVQNMWQVRITWECLQKWIQVVMAFAPFQEGCSPNVSIKNIVRLLEHLTLWYQLFSIRCA